MNEFEFLKNLKPLGHTEGNEKRSRVEFTISFDENSGAPYLSVKGDVDDVDALPYGCAALIRAMRRGRFGFGELEGWGSSNSGVVNLWGEPHLVAMLGGAVDYLVVKSGATGKPVALHVCEEEGRLYLDLQLLGEEKAISPSLLVKIGDETYDAPKFLSDDTLIVGQKLVRVSSVGSNFSSLPSLLTRIPEAQLEMYLSLFLSYTQNITPVYQDSAAKYIAESEEAVPTLVLEKVAQDQALYMRVISTVDSFEGSASLDLPVTRVALIGETGRIMIRDIKQVDTEALSDELYNMIRSSAPSAKAKREVYRDENFFIVPYETASPFLLRRLPDVLSRFKLVGADKLKEYKVSPARPKLNVRLSSGIDFLEGDATVEIGEEKFTLADLLAQYSKQRYVTLSDGNRAIIDDRYINRLRRMFDLKGKKGKVKVSLFDLPEIEDMIQQRIKGELATRSRKVFEGFNNLAGQRLKKPAVKAKLRDYQKQGVKWIQYLYDNKLGGCLADDMGLGKTLQTISVLTNIYPAAELPTLIIMPRSLLFNWQSELQKFAPQLSVATYYGQDRNLDEALKAQVILSTYAVVRNDIEQLKEKKFEYIVLDESQNIKNAASQSSQAVTLLDAPHRLALSGTPIENNLTELYSLFRFLNPTMFGTLEDFNSRYTYPIQKNGDQDTMRSLRRKIFPFMLRRLKKEVLSELPDRIEQTIYVEMNEAQARFYEQRRAAYQQEISRTIAAEGVAKSQFVMFQALSELRRIASVPESLTDGRVRSPKIEELVENVSNAVQNGHKTVVFFNFIAGLELVGERLRELGIECETMTGSTTASARKKIVNRFQNDPECMVLLMTLKVGGVGLNLTAADTVFIFEPWWNKAAEEQAINRLHRIGQKAVVNSYSIITAGTIEEKILQLQEQKKDLFDGLIGSDSASTKHLSEEDINFILS